jgi:NAD(P)-dependent dehydrogenase (short-subunit alcohol dehydrogenase family)
VIRLDQRRILVTGAARGLGRELAAALARMGAHVILADILEAEGHAAAREIGQGARFVAVDLSDLASIAALASNIAGEEGALDGLVNNGAIATGVGGVAFDAVDPALFDRVMAVNVRGTWAMVSACLPLLEKGHEARIVNVASDTALWGAPRLIAYVASKGAVIAMTRSLARELGPKHIGITCVAPGILKTWSTEYVPAERHALYETQRAVPGPQSPQDLVETFAFLLTPGALALTGQCLPVDAGFVFT